MIKSTRYRKSANASPLGSALLFACALAIFLLSPLQHTAIAQSIADSFGGFSQKSDEPINIEADGLEVLDDKKFAIFSGNVKATQGKFQIVSKKLKVTYSGSVGDNKKKKQPQGIKQIDATGKVAISTPDKQSATSDWAKFDVVAKIITIGGNVVLSQGGNVMRGDKLVIDLNTGRSKFHSTTTKNSKTSKRPRITGVFLPGKTKGKSPFGRDTSKKTSEETKTEAKSTPPLPWQKKQ